MSDNPFKPGDMLVCVDSMSCPYLTRRKHYRCEDASKDYIYVIDNAATTGGYYPYRLQLAEQSDTTTADECEPYAIKSSQFDPNKHERQVYKPNGYDIAWSSTAPAVITDWLIVVRDKQPVVETNSEIALSAIWSGLDKDKERAEHDSQRVLQALQDAGRLVEDES